MISPALATRDLAFDECTLLPLSIHVANMREVTCCNHSSVHRHDCFQVLWLLKGRMTVHLDFQSYDLEAGLLMCIAPGQVHRWVYETADTQVMTFSFKAEVFFMHGQDVRATLGRLPFHNASVASLIQIPAQLRDTFDFIFRTALNRRHAEDEGRDRLLLSYLNVILAEAGRMVDAVPNTPLVNAAAQLTQAFRMALEQHFADRKQVQDYAEMLGVTANHFVETVRQMTGYTPGYLVQERLVLEAKRLLVFTSLSTAEIAYRLSFKNPSQFGHWFREREAVSPGEFRRTFAIP